MKRAPNRLRVVRAERRVTQEQIEERTQKRITQTRVSQIENGDADPTAEEKRLLAKVLREPIYKIFPKPEPPQEATS